MTDYDRNLFGEDTSGVTEKMGEFEIYPVGPHPAIMIEAVRENTKDNEGGDPNAGSFIKCVYQFFGGPLEGKKFTSRINLWNKNPEAVRIAKIELKALKQSLNVPPQAGDPQMFLNKPLVLDIGLADRKVGGVKTGEVQNTIKRILPFENEAFAAHQPQTAYTQPGPAPAAAPAPAPAGPQYEYNKDAQGRDIRRLLPSGQWEFVPAAAPAVAPAPAAAPQQNYSQPAGGGKPWEKRK